MMATTAALRPGYLRTHQPLNVPLAAFPSRTSTAGSRVRGLTPQLLSARVARRPTGRRVGVRVEARDAYRQDQYRDVRRGDYDYGPPGGAPPPPPPRPPRGGGGEGGSKFFTPALVAAAFVMGVTAGIGLETNVNFEPDNVASREIIDKQTPNAEVCFANGASAMVLDERVFISLNPFNVYVSQPEVKPGCVLRRSNWSVLEKRSLLSKEEETDCRRNMNTFAFVGDLDKSPEVSCVYHSEEAENQFMRDPRSATLGDGFQPRRSRDFK